LPAGDQSLPCYHLVNPGLAWHNAPSFSSYFSRLTGLEPFGEMIWTLIPGSIIHLDFDAAWV